MAIVRKLDPIKLGRDSKHFEIDYTYSKIEHSGMEYCVMLNSLIFDIQVPCYAELDPQKVQNIID